MSGASAGAVLRAGHLRKLKTMKKKYFVLRGDSSDNSARLEYYESEKKFRSGAAPRRVIPLANCYNIQRRLDLKQKHVIALFTRDEQFCIVAENEQDLHAWLTAILKQHRKDDSAEELLHPIQHVWQVNVQKKGLGASKNIQGLYNLCLTDKTLALVKIKSHNNVISDLSIQDNVEYSLKHIRRCGDSECFFYMEVGRQTKTGAGELWMHSDDSNIAQSMHSTIYHAMRNCAKETESERDHIMIPKRSESESGTAVRRQSFSDVKGRPGLANERGLCVGSCIRQCVSGDESAGGAAPLHPAHHTPHPPHPPATTKHAENQPPNNSLTQEHKDPPRVIKHNRTISLPTGCPLFQEPLKICHGRTRSAPLTGDEVDRLLEKNISHSSCKAVNGTDVFAKKSQWSRRASIGTRLSKLSPAHSKNASAPRNRCDSMPSRASSSFEVERPAPRLNELDASGDISRDEADAVEWHRTPRIPEEPDLCDPAIRDLPLRGSSIHHSLSSGLGGEDPPDASVPAGYLPMAPAHDAGGRVSSSGSVCSGTPSTDPRFSEYQLEPATSHIVDMERVGRAYSVGSRPSARDAAQTTAGRHRAYSVGARTAPRAARPAAAVCSAPLLPRASATDLMELDFSHNHAKVVISGTPPAVGFVEPRPRPSAADEYVDMSPRSRAGYVDMRPGDRLPAPAVPHVAPATITPHVAAQVPGYVEMNYSRAATRPIAIATPRTPPTPLPPPSPPDQPPSRRPPPRTPLGSQTIFPLSLDSPASPPDPEPDIFDDEMPHHPLTTVREISEDGRRSPEMIRKSPENPRKSDEGRKSPDVSSSPSYVKLVYGSKPIAAGNKTSENKELSCNPLATKTIAREPERGGDSTSTATLVLAGAPTVAARFSVSDEPTDGPPAPGGPLNYAALDLEPKKGTANIPTRTYTQIDFARSEKLAADGS